MISSGLPSHISIILERPDTENEDVLISLLTALNAYYECQKDSEGRRQGPLVGYVGKYPPDSLQFVGDIYLNFAPFERYPFILMNVAARLDRKLKSGFMPIDVYLGAPEGGKALAFALASLNPGSRYVYPDRQVITAASTSGREVAKFYWSRHEIGSGDRVAIVEDLNNNFSTTKQLIDLVLAAGATPYVICSFYNRSVEVTGWNYPYGEDTSVSIVTLKSRPIPQYKQDDPFVAEDVKKGNVVWKPKAEWPRLQRAMGLSAI